MDNEKLLHFIAEKVEDIKYAIFYCHSNSPLRINNTIINTYKVNENGQISFFINRPQQLLSQFDQEFPVGLNYFQKGKDYFMNVFGKARIINDPEELAYETDLTTDEINKALTTQVLIRVTILKVDFYDTKFEKKNIVWKKIAGFFSELFDSFGIASGSYDITTASTVHNYGF